MVFSGALSSIYHAKSCPKVKAMSDAADYQGFLEEAVIGTLFLQESDLPDVFENLYKLEYFVINVPEASRSTRYKIQETIIEASGYADSGAMNDNVFYELISDLRWLNSKKIAIILHLNGRDLKEDLFWMLNCISEGSGRLRMEQERDLVMILSF